MKEFEKVKMEFWIKAFFLEVPEPMFPPAPHREQIADNALSEFKKRFDDDGELPKK